MAAVDAVQPLHRVVAKQQQRQLHQLQTPPQPVAALVQEKVQYHQLIQFTVVKLAWPHYGGIVMQRAHQPSKKRSPGSLTNTAFAVPGKGHAMLVEQFMKELCVQYAIPFIVISAGV